MPYLEAPYTRLRNYMMLYGEKGTRTTLVDAFDNCGDQKAESLIDPHVHDELQREQQNAERHQCRTLLAQLPRTASDANQQQPSDIQCIVFVKHYSLLQLAKANPTHSTWRKTLLPFHPQQWDCAARCSK